MQLAHVTPPSAAPAEWRSKLVTRAKYCPFTTRNSFLRPTSLRIPCLSSSNDICSPSNDSEFLQRLLINRKKPESDLFKSTCHPFSNKRSCFEANSIKNKSALPSNLLLVGEGGVSLSNNSEDKATRPFHSSSPPLLLLIKQFSLKLAGVVLIIISFVSSYACPAYAAPSNSPLASIATALPSSTPRDLRALQNLFGSVDRKSEYQDFLSALRKDVLARYPHLATNPEALEREVFLRSKGKPVDVEDLRSRSTVLDPNSIPRRTAPDQIVERYLEILPKPKGTAEAINIGRGETDVIAEREGLLAPLEFFPTTDPVANNAPEAKTAASEKLFHERLRNQSGLADSEDLEALLRKSGDSESTPSPHSLPAATKFNAQDTELTSVLLGPEGSVRSGWRLTTPQGLEKGVAGVSSSSSSSSSSSPAAVGRPLAYSEFMRLVQEGHVASVRFFGPADRLALMATLDSSAPGGSRICKIVCPPDPFLLESLASHGVVVQRGPPLLYDEHHRRLAGGVLNALLKVTVPLLFVGTVFWLAHSWILDPGNKRPVTLSDFLRDKLEVKKATRLDFRSPATIVHIDVASPDFVSWDNIRGIDGVKREVQEVIDYLKDPALLKARGVNRVGGLLLAGPPGTGKTLLARAIAAESGVRMLTCSGTDFRHPLSGVGPRRMRETFSLLRRMAPAILFVDEFDSLGATRSTSGLGSEELASIINEMLVQMDGFEDNRGIVVMAATNRPDALDAALLRPGRLDRVVHMPLPDITGRSQILQVHARGRKTDPTIDWRAVARAIPGFTGADCMGLMNRAARLAARQGHEFITEDDIFAALEERHVEDLVDAEAALAKRTSDAAVPPALTPRSPVVVPERLRKLFAVHEIGKALVTYITPDFADVARVSLNPNGVLGAITLLIENDAGVGGGDGGESGSGRSDNGSSSGISGPSPSSSSLSSSSSLHVRTKSFLESKIVALLAGRIAERLVFGQGELSPVCDSEAVEARALALTMVMKLGMGMRTGPLNVGGGWPTTPSALLPTASLLTSRRRLRRRFGGWALEEGEGVGGSGPRKSSNVGRSASSSGSNSNSNINNATNANAKDRQQQTSLTTHRQEQMQRASRSRRAAKNINSDVSNPNASNSSNSSSNNNSSSSNPYHSDLGSIPLAALAEEGARRDLLRLLSLGDGGGAMEGAADRQQLLLTLAEAEEPLEAPHITPEQRADVEADVAEILGAAEAKAMYGLTANWPAMEAAVKALLRRNSLTGKELAKVLEQSGVSHFPSQGIEGFGWVDEKAEEGRKMGNKGKKGEVKVGKGKLKYPVVAARDSALHRITRGVGSTGAVTKTN